MRFRTFRWCEANGDLTAQLKELWSVNPKGAINKRSLKLNNQLYVNAFQFLGFSDGSFKVRSDGIVQSGMGGFIKNLKNDIVFIFSGNIQATSPLQAEIKAISFMIEAVNSSDKCEDKCMFYTDSENAMSLILQAKAGFLKESDMLNLGVSSMVRKSNFFFKQVDWTLISGADYLAKMGAQRNNIIQKWSVRFVG